jgi:MoaA/NifB/PqqE/SkfB family radical SAM enzyme
MRPIVIPETHNYIAVFLSLACNLKCSYCINRFEEFTYEKGRLSGETGSGD